MTDSRYKLVLSLEDSLSGVLKYRIEDKGTGMLSESFTLEDIYISKLGMYEDLRIVYSFMVALEDIPSEEVEEKI